MSPHSVYGLYSYGHDIEIGCASLPSQSSHYGLMTYTLCCTTVMGGVRSSRFAPLVIPRIRSWRLVTIVTVSRGAVSHANQPLPCARFANAKHDFHTYYPQMGGDSPQPVGED